MAKEITTTLEELLNVMPALARMMAVKVNEQLRYHAMKLDGLVEPHLKHFMKRNQELIEEFGGTERTPTGAERAANPGVTFYDIPEPGRKAFAAKKNELLAVAVVIPWGPITLSMVKPYEEITGAICKGLGPLFELDPPSDEKTA